MKLSYLILFGLLLTACNTPRYAGVNNMNAQPATVYFKNGSQTGQLSIGLGQFNFSTVKYIQFATGTSNDYKYYRPTDIVGFMFNGSYYYGKYMNKSQAYFTPENKTFVKLLTEKDSKIKMYQYSATNTVTNGNGTKSTVSSKENYIEMPNTVDDVIYGFNSNKFCPSFDEKVSIMVADKPALAQKIRNKDKQFFYPLVTNDEKRLQVWWNIINEYNQY